MNPDQNNNEPKVIQPQWQYTSGNLSQQQAFNAQPEASPTAQPVPTAENIQPAESQEPQTVTTIESTQLEQPTSVTDAQPNSELSNSPEQALISWRASEFAASDKNSSWYMLLAVGSVIFAALTYLLTKQIFSVIVILILGITVAFYGRLKPRVLDYSIDKNGIFVGNKYYLFSQFKSFSIIEDQAIPSIHLMPIKKLMMPITIYIAPSEADNIIDILGNILPFEDRKRDIADKISQKLRF